MRQQPATGSWLVPSFDLRDYVLSCPWHVAAAVYRAAEGRHDLPSDICWVDTGSAGLPHLIR
jgi:hypothetical protein